MGTRYRADREQEAGIVLLCERFEILETRGQKA